MDEPTRCADLAESLAEVATGAASGPDRARVLSHLGECESCRRELEELTQIADEVLLIARTHEPPAGFESAVLDRIAAIPREAEAPVPLTSRRRRFTRPLLVAAAAGVVGLAAAGAVWQATEPDRELAAAYRDTLDVADGHYFAAADLRAPGADSAGTVFFYEGEPSWLFVLVRDAPVAGEYDVVVDAGGNASVVGTCVVDGSTCSTGTTLDVGVYAIDEVRLVSADGSVTLTATPSR